MPQFGNRKKPFSAKQKKKQLQDRRDRKRDKEESGCKLAKTFALSSPSSQVNALCRPLQLHKP